MAIFGSLIIIGAIIIVHYYHEIKRDFIQSITGKICQKCGAINAAEAKFCMKCGSQLQA